MSPKSDIQRSFGGGLSSRERVIEGELGGRPAMPRPVERATSMAVAKQYGRAIVGTARVRGVHHVSREAMRALADLESKESAAAARNQFTAGRRQQRLVDTATLAFDDAIFQTGMGFE